MGYPTKKNAVARFLDEKFEVAISLRELRAKADAEPAYGISGAAVMRWLPVFVEEKRAVTKAIGQHTVMLSWKREAEEKRC